MIGICAAYLILSISLAERLQPDTDEAVLANPGYNLAYHGHLGTTLYQLGDYMPESMAEHTYWQPPLYFFTTAAWYELWGFGLLQVRMLSVLCGLIAILAWYKTILHLLGSATPALLTAALIGADYFFLNGAARGRMDLMCAALGAIAFAAYATYRETSRAKAVFLSSLFAGAAIVTHPVGIVYAGGLTIFSLWLDWRHFALKYVGIAVCGYMIFGTLWILYILQSPADFFAQLNRALEINEASFLYVSQSSNRYIRYLQQELTFRYESPFGLLPSASLASRPKAVVLITYLSGMIGLLSIRRLRQQHTVSAVALLFPVAFLLMAEISPSKFSYYLPHVTAMLAACLGVFLHKTLIEPAGRLRWLVAVLGIVLGIQLAGSAYLLRGNSLGNVYQPTIDAILANSPDGSLVLGSGALWFNLSDRRTLIHDPWLGAHSGYRPAIFVMEVLYRAQFSASQTMAPDVYRHVQDLLDQSRLVYENGYYQVYVPEQPDHP